MSKFVRTKKHPDRDLFLKTYTKSAFYKKQWDEETINARGHVYDGEGNPLATPMPKIFNLDEHATTSRRAVVERIVADKEERLRIDLKLNGHLAILFHDGEGWRNITKGSFEHEFIEPDRELMRQVGFTDDVLAELPVHWTLMFEIVGDHDPHLLTEATKDIFGGERAILLGVNSRISGKPITCYEEYLRSLGCIIYDISVPLASFMEMWEIDATSELEVSELLDRLLDLQNIEGHIIFDPVDNFRVKLKTHWFIRERYKFQFNHERTRNIFLKHLDTDLAFDKIPEELHDAYNRILDAFEEYCDKTSFNAMEYLQLVFGSCRTKDSAKLVIDEAPNLSDDEKELLRLYMDVETEEYEEKVKTMFANAVESFSLVDLT